MSMLQATATGPVDTIAWRRDYEAKLKAPDGWLAVAGLYWLHEGANTIGSGGESDAVLPKRFPAHMGTVTLAGNTATLRTAEGEKTLTAEKDPVRVQDVWLALIWRNKKYALRLRDPEAESRRRFTGTKWYPVKDAYRVTAKWVPYDSPHQISIASVLGYTEPEPAPGYAEFLLGGQTFRLEPVVEEPGDLFFIFKDQTAGHETYGAGRFLHAADAKDGKVVLDFNRAYNPPCAYTEFATCPLPPKQNRLATRVEAGELRYGSH